MMSFWRNNDVIIAYFLLLDIGFQDDPYVFQYACAETDIFLGN